MTSNFRAAFQHPDELRGSLSFFFDKFGRWDDGFYVTKGSKLWEDFLQLCADRIKANDHLVIKWMPSEKKKLDNDTEGFKHLCRKLNWSPKQLRLHFTKNRVSLVETKLMKKDHGSIDYNHVPGKAMLKYSGKEGTFMRNDEKRFVHWKESLSKPESKAKVNVKTLHPIEIIRKYLNSREMDPLLEEMWNSFDVGLFQLEDTMVMSDVSGSMNHPDGKPLGACISLSLLIAPMCAYKNTGEFLFILVDFSIPYELCSSQLFLILTVLTFAENPEFFEIKGNSLFEKTKNLMTAPWGGCTNIQKAFDQILQTVKRGMIRMPKRLIIISD